MPILAAYGHSYVLGSAATTTSRRFVNIVTSRLGSALENNGVGGALSTDTAEKVMARPPAAADHYLLMTGVNDARLYGSSRMALDDYGSALGQMFGAFLGVDPRCQVIAVAHPHLQDYSQHAPYDHACDELLDAYNRRLEEIAEQYSQVSVATVEDWDTRTMLAVDTVHPNDLGHQKLAQAVLRALETSGPLCIP